MGEILLAKGLITQEQLERAIEARSRTDLLFGEVLVVLGFAEEEAITRCLAEQFDLPIASLETINPSADALGLVSSFFALTRLFLPVQISDATLVAVISDPIDLDLTDRMARDTGRRLSLSIASPSALTKKIARCYELAPIKPIDTTQHAAPKPKRRTKIDVQTDRHELLVALQSTEMPPLRLIG
ncbi:MAG: hypothetical protein ACHQ50_15640 [Fimbriimonadales bacterium]